MAARQALSPSATSRPSSSTRAVHPADAQIGEHRQRAPIDPRLGRAGLRDPRRAEELQTRRDAPTPVVDHAEGPRGVQPRALRLQSGRDPDDDMTIEVDPGQTIAIVRAHGRGQDHPGQPAHALLRDRRRRHHRRRVDIRRLRRRRAATHVRHGAPGYLALQRHDPREHRLRPRGRHRRRNASPRPRPPTPTTSSARCHRATTRCSTRKHPTSRRDRSSC